MVDENTSTGDNVFEPIPRQKGKYLKINKQDLPPGWTFCDNHEEELDPTETHENFQGYVCKNCGRGRLVTK